MKLLVGFLELSWEILFEYIFSFSKLALGNSWKICTYLYLVWPFHFPPILYEGFLFFLFLFLGGWNIRIIFNISMKTFLLSFAEIIIIKPQKCIFLKSFLLLVSSRLYYATFNILNV